MLAMARALCLEPHVLLLDEPTEGLMPSMIARIRETVSTLRERGVSTILVEQRVDAVLSVADRVAFIENGRLQGDGRCGAVARRSRAGEALCRRGASRRQTSFTPAFFISSSIAASEPLRSMARQASSRTVVSKPRPAASSAE